jgi:2-dehydro-3-deoxyphosphogluconate aldolase/(4S)-4-hydroxy-2-oxoglutarate aldolase
MIENMNTREKAIYWTKEAGVLPAIKIKAEDNVIPYVRAMLEGGVHVVEITTTTPNAFKHFEAIEKEFKGEVLTAAGTVLDAATARLAILSGVKILVSPSLCPDVIATAKRYGMACYAGAFSATEVQKAMELGVDMVKIFPAALGGPKYMTNLRMVYPEVNLIPSGGVSLETAGEFIKAGACAISGARNFFNYEMVKKHGNGWITEQIKKYIQIVAEARQIAPPLP